MKMTKKKTKQTAQGMIITLLEVKTLAGMWVLTVPGSLSAPAVTKKWTHMPVRTQRQEQK